MYGNQETYDDAYDEADDESSDDESYEEARRRRHAPRPVRSAPRVNTYQAPTLASVANSPVTQIQLKAYDEKLRTALKGTNERITQVDARARKLITEQERFDTGSRKDAVERRKEISAVRRDLNTATGLGVIANLVPTLLGANNALTPFAPVLPLLPSLMNVNNPSGGTGSANAGTGGGWLGGFGGIVPLIAVALVVAKAFPPKPTNE
jgi:hypothetical protein